MARKKKEVIKVLEITERKYNETLELLKLAEQEEKEILETVEKTINELIEANEIFCGVVLSPQDLGKIVELAASSKENIRIPYRLYFNETKE